MPYLVDPVVDPSRLSSQEPEIAADGLVLRRWTNRDAPQLRAAFADPAIQQWNLRTLESVGEAERLIAAWRQAWKRHTGASWAVVRPEDRSTVLGQVGFRSLYLVDGMAEVSYWVAPGERQQGVAGRAASALADWAMTGLALERLELVHSVRNIPSCRVAITAGFEVEGTKRRLQKHADGWHDMHLHARVRTEEPVPAATRAVPPLRSRLAARIDRSVRVGGAGGRPALIG